MALYSGEPCQALEDLRPTIHFRGIIPGPRDSQDSRDQGDEDQQRPNPKVEKSHRRSTPAGGSLSLLLDSEKQNIEAGTDVEPTHGWNRRRQLHVGHPFASSIVAF